MKPVPYREVKRKLEAAGFVQVYQTESHAKFAKTTSEGTLTATQSRSIVMWHPEPCEASCDRRASANKNSNDYE